MLKKIISTLFLLAAMTAVAGATDLGGGYTLTLTLAADSSDSAAAIIDTAITIPINVGEWANMNMRWVVETEADWDDDTIDIKGQYSYSSAATATWYDIDGFADQILIGGDSAGRNTSIAAPRDSFGVYVRALITHSVTPAQAQAQDSAGESYTWRVVPYFDKVNK